MAPEQAKGRAVDKRADIWAFGVVLYEMLAGTRAFKGDDVSDTLASVLKETPDLGALPASTPLRLKELLARCLEKDPRMRQRDMGDVALELAAIEAQPEAVRSAAARPPRSTFPTAALVAATLALGFAGGWLLHRAPAANAPVRFLVPVPSGGNGGSPQLTPDGRVLVFESNGRLYRRSLDSFDTTVIPG